MFYPIEFFNEKKSTGQIRQQLVHFVLNIIY